MNSNQHVSRGLLLGLLSLTTTTISRAALFDLNSSGQLASNFNTSGATLTYGANTGVGGSGGFTGVNNSSSAIYANTGISSSVGSTLTASLTFKMSAVGPNNDGSNYTDIRAGFSTMSTSANVNDGALAAYGSYKTQNEPDIGVSNNGVSIGLTGYGSGLALTANSWYKLDSIFTKNATVGDWTYEVNLYSLGSNGTGTPSLVGGSSYSHTSAVGDRLTFYNTGTLYPFFSLSSAVNDGIPTIDNIGFSSVPEPSTYAAMFGVGLFGFATLRKTRPQWLKRSA